MVRDTEGDAKWAGMVGDMVASIYIHFIQCTLVGAEGSTHGNENDAWLPSASQANRGTPTSRDASLPEQGIESDGGGRFHWSVSMVPLSLAKKWRSRHRKAFIQRPRWLDDLPPFAPSLAPLPPGKGGQPLPAARTWHSDYQSYSLAKEKTDTPLEGK